MLSYGLIAIGSALGGMARYWCSVVVARRLGEAFPLGTLLVNIAGSFVIGLFAALTATGGALAGDGAVRAFVIIGLCGGYTTFSSFSLQTLILAFEGEFLRAAGNILASVALCLLAAWLGFAAGSAGAFPSGG